MGDNNTLGEQEPPQASRRLPVAVVPLLGLIAVIVGLIVAWKGKDEPTGWFAYAPLSNTVFPPSGGSFISQGTQLGLLLAVLGLLVLAFWAGLTIGRRRT
ncbi:hypothetical protein [Paenarthrobacter nitroguajacolicus]|uniref:hypothetical protein n=1 Tax=Paenarthrobacter nitroguajacolicus TaxID=211146 RepID=UPI00248C7B8F|nr:hypothetical protein [Paenarthrobacter nitroguajacolicus]MDI2034662.1 hypothetical protein [Paenarthrobacter nitroguajacolicus]